MSQYDIVQVSDPINLSNVTQCIPHDQFIRMLPDIVLKADAYKLAIGCFIAGMLVQILIDWLYKRYGHGNS